MTIFFSGHKKNNRLSLDEKKGLRLKHITDQHELDAAEQLNIAKGVIWLQHQNRKEILSPSFWCLLHKKLLSDVWNWAGKFRTSDRNIGVSHYQVQGECRNLSNDALYWIKHQTYSPTEFTARFHHRLVFIHPFSNGNGRFARILTNHLLSANGMPPLKWAADLTPQERRKLYIKGLKKADRGDYSELENFIQLG